MLDEDRRLGISSDGVDGTTVDGLLELLGRALLANAVTAAFQGVELPAGWEDRWSAVRVRFALDDLDSELLLLAVLPLVDPRVELGLRLLSVDGSATTSALATAVLRHRPSFEIALRLLPQARLAAAGVLVNSSGREGPHLPDGAVLGFLLGAPYLPAPLARALVSSVPPDPRDAVLDVARALRDSGGVHLHERHGAYGRATATTAAALLGLDAVVLDLARIEPAEQSTVLEAAVLHARLHGAVLVVGPWDVLSEPRAAESRLGPLPVITHGSAAWPVRGTSRRPRELEVLPLDAGARALVVEAVLEELGRDDVADEFVPVVVSALSGLEVDVMVPVLQDVLVDRDAPVASLRAPLLARSRELAERDAQGVARIVVPDEQLADVVATPAVQRALRALVDRVRHRDLVLDGWGLSAVVRSRRGTCALLAGPPGTGKTMSARAVAGELGMPLWSVDLASVLDKYVGEAEKRLERIFDAVDRAQGVLLIDEADALFGRRGAVSDARDRYANSSISYLLQRMEAFAGTLLLTTNMQGNLDEAFLRRLDDVVVLDAPDRAEREQLWRRHLVPGLPLDVDVLPQRLADLPLTGGDIRNTVMSAAARAAAEGRRVSADLLTTAARDELRKQGRLL